MRAVADPAFESWAKRNPCFIALFIIYKITTATNILRYSAAAAGTAQRNGTGALQRVSEGRRVPMKKKKLPANKKPQRQIVKVAPPWSIEGMTIEKLFANAAQLVGT